MTHMLALSQPGATLHSTGNLEVQMYWVGRVIHDPLLIQIDQLLYIPCSLHNLRGVD